MVPEPVLYMNTWNEDAFDKQTISVNQPAPATSEG